MNFHAFEFADTQLQAYGSGALFWPDEKTLVVSDLHLGKSERIARRSGQLLPPYETRDTLAQLDAVIQQLRPGKVICLGDSFDDLKASRGMHEEEMLTMTRMMAGRDWVWIEGNHDPGPLELGGTHRAELTQPPLVFRHIATASGRGEVSGHFHPKTSLSLRGRHVSRPCFLVTQQRLILPAFGTYTGGLRLDDPAFSTLIDPESYAIITGTRPCAVPVKTARLSRQPTGFSQPV